MSNTSDNKLKANELRKKGDIESALPLYKELWESSNDKFDAAGLIFCYRKLKKFDEAIPLAIEAYSKFPDFEWCKNEYIWTLIQAQIFTFPEDGNLTDLITLVEKIIEAKPDEIAYKIIVFRLIKFAKKNSSWEVLNTWLLKINVDILNGYTDESTGWTDKELWYYYRVNGLLYTNNEEEAISIVENKKNEFYKQKKFFERLKAKAYINLGRIDDAIATYKLIVTSKTDWWLHKELGNLYTTQNNIDAALSSLLNAALIPPMKLELKVSLFDDIGDIYLLLDKKDWALKHFLLVKAIRLEHEWSCKDIDSKISELTSINNNENLKTRTLLEDCKSIWNLNSNDQKTDNPNNKKTKNLKGKITSFYIERPFCFIKTNDGESFFCSSNDLPKNIKDGQLVKFDIKQSFDKKKNIDTYRAFNISISN